MDQPKSLASFFSGLRPRNRPERGGTLRPTTSSSPNAGGGRRPSSHSNKHHAAPSSDKITPPPPRRTSHNIITSPPLLPDKTTTTTDISKHHARHALRKSGDFLGVTGVNPRTGEMDVLTPTTGSDDTAGGVQGDPRLAQLAQRAQEAREEYEAARGDVIRERAERRKEGVRQVLGEGGVRWRREEGGWSSVAEARGDGVVSFLGRGGAPTTLALDCRRRCAVAGGGAMGSGGALGSVGRRVGSVVGGGAMASLSLRTRAFQLRFPSLIPTRKRSRGRVEGKRSVAARDGGSRGPAQMRMDESVMRLRLEKQVPAERWAETVNRDLDDVDSRSPMGGFTHGSLVRLTPGQRGAGEAQRRSASTSTITTTGFGCNPMPCQLHPGCGAKADTSDHPMPDSADSAAMVKLPMTRTRPSSSESSDRTDSWTCLDRAASPLAARPNSWPSTAGGRALYPTTLQVVVDGRVVATIEPVSSSSSSSKVASPGPPSDTISVQDETATSDYGGETPSPQQQQESPRLRGGNQRHKEMRKTMRRNGVDESVGEGSRSSTPTGPPHWWTAAARSELLGRKPAPGPRGGLDTALMAREAARTAYCCGNRSPAASPGASSGTVMVVGHGGAPLPQPVLATTVDDDKKDGDKEDEHHPPQAAIEGNTGDPSSTLPPAVEPAPEPGSEWGQPGDSPILVLQAVLAVVMQVGAAYWRLVKPVFMAESAVRQRFEQGKSTWDDFALYVLAMVFLLLGVLAGVWMYRGLVGSVKLVGAVGKACLVLAGL